MKIILLISACTLFIIGCHNQNNTSSTPTPTTTTIVNTTSQQVQVVNVDDADNCLNYLKGKTFYGGNAKIEFTNDGNASAYSQQNNSLVFTGSITIGERYGNASRKFELQSTDGNGILKFVLSSDGKFMSETDMTIYKP